MIRRNSALPSGVDLNRIRVPDFNHGRPPMLAYDQLEETDEEMARRMDKSDEDPNLSLDDERDGENEGQEIDPPELSGLSREQLENFARRFFLLYMTGKAEPSSGTADRKRAEDRKRRAGLGMDARAVQSFNDRYPDAARITR